MRVAQLITAPDGSLAASKLCYVLYVIVMTIHMLRASPADPLMWLVYGATVGGVEVAKKGLNLHYTSRREPAFPMPDIGNGDRP